MFGRLHVAPIALDFLSLHPQLNLRSHFVDRVVHLLDENFDVAVRFARLADSGLAAVRVGSVREVVVALPAPLETHGEPKTPAAAIREYASSGWEFMFVNVVDNGGYETCARMA